MRRWERTGIGALAVALVVLPTAVHGWPATVAGNVFTAALLAAALATMWWRRPRLVAVAGGALSLVPAFLADYGWFPDSALVLLPILAAMTALGWRDRAAPVAAGLAAGYLLVLWSAVGGTSAIALAVLSLPGYAAGTVLRLRRETADELAQRARELEQEGELYAELARREERARIAAELHDIVGHAISVMVIQAAAGQRLVESDPVRARQAFAAIADSAEQGTQDLQRLLDLLGGAEMTDPDLSLIDEIVDRAARSGLDVSCRFDGDHRGVDAPTAHVAYRLVQESLTNALRHAPGAPVRVHLTGSNDTLTVSIHNGPSTLDRPALAGTGRGVSGLRDRVRELDGQLIAGPSPDGGWLVRAVLPTPH